MVTHRGAASRRTQVGTVVAGLAAVTLVIGLVSSAPRASADHDGAAAFALQSGMSLVPQTVATTGGVTRIYGSGFHGVTAVRFGTTPSPEFAVVDEVISGGDLIFAQVPPGTNNAVVDVTLEDPQGNATCSQCFSYTNATMSANPAASLSDRASVTVSVSGYHPNEEVVVAEETARFDYAFPRPDALPPPYLVPLRIGIPTGSGDFTDTVTLRAEPNFNTPDPDAQCPPTQEDADHGLVSCFIGVAGLSTVKAPVSFTGSPAPSAPTLTLNPTGSEAGASVEVAGANWSGNPNFGSSTSPSRPGETQLAIELCNADGSGCIPVTDADAEVSFVLYAGSEPNFTSGRLTGATLDGSFTVPSGGCTADCAVRVTQTKVDGESISATAPLAAGGSSGGQAPGGSSGGQVPGGSSGGQAPGGSTNGQGAGGSSAGRDSTGTDGAGSTTDTSLRRLG